MTRIYRRTIQKYLHDPGNHDGVITHLEPDPGIRSQLGLRKHHYEKASGGDRIPAEPFKSSKVML